jgi:intein/homing endonuclease
MFHKFALKDCKLIALSKNADNSDILVKVASGKIIVEPNSEKAKIIEAEVKKHPNALFFRAKAIEANKPNSNGDFFSEEELLKAYKSFEGVPFFTNHDNQNIENARGKIIFAEWVPEEKACYTVAFVDRDAYPHICRSIEEEYVNGVSMGAVQVGTMITLPDLTEKPIEDIKEGDIVLSHKGNCQKVLKVHSAFLGKPMYELFTSTYHRSPLFTEDHPIFSISKEEINSAKKKSIKEAAANKYERRKGKTNDIVGQDIWRKLKYNIETKEAKDITIGDYVLVPSKFNLLDGASENSDLFYIYGAFIGDGYLKKDKNGEFEAVSFCLGLKDKKLIEKIKNILPKYTKSEICETICEERNGIYLSVYDRDLANSISELFGTGSGNKRIKFPIKNIEDAKNLLCGYLDTDGCIVDKTNQDVRGSKFGGFQISSVNIKLLEDIQSLLISLGYISRISTFERVPSKNSVVNINTIENTLAIGSNAYEAFKNSIKYANCKFDKNEIAAGKSFIVEDETIKYMACPVKAIKKHNNFDKPVYDLTVENDESYIADGMAVHNCSVEKSVCNICSNVAEKTDDYCTHIKNRKGRKFTGSARDVVTGEVKQFKDQPVFEYNFGLKFIELSAVVDPACPTCRIQGVIPNAEYLSKVANMENSLRMVRTAAMEKQASKEEIDQIEGVLTTLEQIAVNLIKNRKQVEMEFASDLVEILSKLQTWLDELVGAGYGNLKEGVPGSADEQPAQGEQPAPTAPAPQLPPSTGTATVGAVPAAAETQIGSVSGAPGKQAVTPPRLPITAPLKPRAEVEDSRTIQRLSDYRVETGKQVLIKAASLCNKMSITGDMDMAKRRTIMEKQASKEMAKEVLSNSWKEKQSFFEYINKVPSIQDNENRLAVKKSDDSFIIVAEKKNASSNDDLMVWKYEDLTNEQKQMIKEYPKQAAVDLLDTFAQSLKTKKEGVKKMTDINKNAGATTVNAVPEVVQEKQLEQKGLYHSRTGVEADQVTQAQLESLRKGEQEVVTEAQLKNAPKLNPRTGEEAQEVQEKQLDPLRKKDEKDVITQAQLEANRVNNEQDVITEAQLKSTPAPWARSANRNAAQFKSAAQHIKEVVNVMADSVISAGCTPEEVCEVSAALVGTTKDRYDLATSILEVKAGTDVDFAKRAAFWNNKNLKVASTGKKEIAQLIVDGLRKVASDVTINPEVLISAVDVIGEGGDSIGAVSNKVDEKLEAATKEERVASNIKSELRAALKTPDKADKALRDEERKNLLASASIEKEVMQREAERQNFEKILNKKVLANSDVVIDTDFSEIGCKKDDPKFRSTVVSFAKGALASQNIKMAAVTNVTISGDTIQIAVQTDEGSEEVEIPVGDESAPAPEETVPEGDISGEGLENAVPPAAPAPAPTAAAPAMASSKSMKKVAQSPMGGGIPGTPGGVSAPGASDQVPGGDPKGDAVQSLSANEGAEGAEDVPTVGEQQMPWTICPECGSSDVDVTNDNGDIKGKCNNAECGAEYEALVKKSIEFKIVKPSKAMSGEGTAETPEAPAESPEVPALPVAAQTRIDKKTIVRMGSNKQKYGHVCPACGKTACKTTKDNDGHTEFKCPACSTDVEKDVIVSKTNPDIAFLRVKWDIRPIAKKNCKDCDEKVAKFASRIRVEKLLKSAEASGDKFPMGNCIERLARQYGGNVVASYGPCKGKALAECVCKQLKSLALTKVRHLTKLAEVSMQKDPFDECVEDQKKSGHSIKEASSICNCLKKKFASKDSDNIYVQAFAEDIDAGIEKSFSKKDLESLYEIEQEKQASVTEKQVKIAADEEIGADLPELNEAEVEVSVVKEAKTADAIKEAGVVPGVPDGTGPHGMGKEKGRGMGPCGQDGKNVKEEIKEEVKEEIKEECSCGKEDCKICNKAKKEAMAMNGQRVRSVNEEVLKMASKPTKIETIEQDVEAGVPRSQAYMGKEQQADSMINKTPAKPNVPRSEAYMGKEKEADSMINKPLNLPDVAVDSSYMGQEKDVQKGMPAINNEIKGTVIAKDEKVTKEAKKMKEVDTVEKDVESGVPRADAKMGEESKADSLINSPNKGPDVPRSDAYMGKEKEADSMINEKLDGPDVPIDSAYMGKEKEAQKGMPGINDEMLKNVKAQREGQMDKIVRAREQQAMKVVSWLVANKRVPSDMETFDYTVKALAGFEIDKIATVAEKMFPERAEKSVRTSPVTEKTVEAHSIPAIVLESKSNDSGNDFQKRLANAFTIGNSKFDSNLTMYGEKK